MFYRQKFPIMKPSSTFVVLLVALSATIYSCNNKSKTPETIKTDSTGYNAVDSGAGDRYDTSFSVEAESFADLQLLRYQVPGFTGLSPQQKELAYYLYEAALCGRDIIYDQKSKYGIMLRKTLETMYSSGKRDTSSTDWKKFEEYCGRVWFSNGNHHHYGNEKFIPGCSFDYFSSLLKSADTASLPKEAGETVQAFLTRIKPIVYDLKIESKLIDLRPDIDNVVASSVNFYEGVTQQEVDSFYAKFPKEDHQRSWGLNSKTVKENGQVVEKVWKVGGMYSTAIERIAGWLEKASAVAENAEQKKALEPAGKILPERGSSHI